MKRHAAKFPCEATWRATKGWFLSIEIASVASNCGSSVEMFLETRLWRHIRCRWWGRSSSRSPWDSRGSWCWWSEAAIRKRDRSLGWNRRWSESKSWTTGTNSRLVLVLVLVLLVVVVLLLLLVVVIVVVVVVVAVVAAAAAAAAGGGVVVVVVDGRW